MKTTHEHYKYFDRHTAEKMHLESKHFLLELYFIRDEHHFFEELIETYSFQLIVTEKFAQNRKLIENWNIAQKKNDELIENLIEHENKLEVLLNKSYQTVTEIKYMLWHKNILKDTEEHLTNYKKIKRLIFDMIKGIMKKQKQKHLLKN